MSQTVTPQPKTRPVLFSLLILLSGIAIGVGGTLIFIKQKPTPPRPNFNARMINHLMRELKLTEEQKAQIDPLIQTHMDEFEKIRTEAIPKITQITETMNNEILQLLDDNQKQIWADQMKRMRENFERMRNNRRGPRQGQGPGDGQWRRDRDGSGPDGRGRGPGRDPNSPYRRRRPPAEGMGPENQPPLEPRPPQPDSPQDPKPI